MGAGEKLGIECCDRHEGAMGGCSSCVKAVAPPGAEQTTAPDETHAYPRSARSRRPSFGARPLSVRAAVRLLVQISALGRLPRGVWPRGASDLPS